jgi:hypothetical protein
MTLIYSLKVNEQGRSTNHVEVKRVKTKLLNNKRVKVINYTKTTAHKPYCDVILEDGTEGIVNINKYDFIDT